jgi:mono/diheme cytochrome c family protein
MNARSKVFASVFLLMLAVIAGCEKNPGSGYNPPADHTTNMGGYMHKSGLGQPLANCVSCHGSDLKGGTSGVSCFECHGTKW